jgi:aspartate kinase
MLELASLGAKVLQTRSVELAMRYKMPLQVRSSFSDEPGTLVCDEEDIMEQNVVSGVAYSRNEAKITVRDVPDHPGVASAIFTPLSEAAINIDMIVQNVSEDSQTDMTFSLSMDDVERAKSILENAQDTIKYRRLDIDTDVAKVSIVGIGMRSHTGIAQKMFSALAKENINIAVITTSEIKTSVLIQRKYMELAVQSLHSAFELDKMA